MQNTEFVKYYRTEKEENLLKYPNALSVYMYLSMHAVSQDTLYRETLLHKGQYADSCRHIAQMLDLKRTAVEKCLKFLRENEYIAMQVHSSRKYSVFTVLNYAEDAVIEGVRKEPEEEGLRRQEEDHSVSSKSDADLNGRNKENTGQMQSVCRKEAAYVPRHGKICQEEQKVPYFGSPGTRQYKEETQKYLAGCEEAKNRYGHSDTNVDMNSDDEYICRHRRKPVEKKVLDTVNHEANECPQEGRKEIFTLEFLNFILSKEESGVQKRKYGHSMSKSKKRSKNTHGSQCAYPSQTEKPGNAERYESQKTEKKTAVSLSSPNRQNGLNLYDVMCDEYRVMDNSDKTICHNHFDTTATYNASECALEKGKTDTFTGFSSSVMEKAREILSYLTANGGFLGSSALSPECYIAERLQEGYTEEDCRQIIDYQADFCKRHPEKKRYFTAFYLFTKKTIARSLEYAKAWAARVKDTLTGKDTAALPDWYNDQTVHPADPSLTAKALEMQKLLREGSLKTENKFKPDWSAWGEEPCTVVPF